MTVAACEQATRPRFWETVPLEQMTQAEWEAVCDGCGKCCLHKLKDDVTGEVRLTRVACHLLNTDSGRCREYSRRRQRVRDCLVLTPANLPQCDWLPASCAYRCLLRGEELPGWHHLVSGDRNSIREAGASVRGWSISAEFVHEDDFEEHVVSWVR